MEMEKDNDEPVMCSKCNKTFENDSEYLEHYNQNHKSEKVWKIVMVGSTLIHCLETISNFDFVSTVEIVWMVKKLYFFGFFTLI